MSRSPPLTEEIFPAYGDVGEDPGARQRRAADPGHSVWVSASAGSGKTKVLTDRLLRLLLPREDGMPGTAPQKLLCLTFTKAGANEMVLRLMKRLSLWASAKPHELEKDMGALLGRAPSQDEQAAARRLFAAVTDAPGGLNIMTIHAFCGAVLGRFPLEAGLPPNFTALEEAQAGLLLTKARDEVLLRARREPETKLAQAVFALAAAQSEEGFDKLLAGITSERRQLKECLRTHGGVEAAYDGLCSLLGVPPGADEDTLLRQALAPGALDEPGLRAAVAVLAEGTAATDQPRAVSIQSFLDAEIKEREALYPTYRRSFIKAEGGPLKALMTSKLAARAPDLLRVLEEEQERLLALDDQLKAVRCARFSHMLLRIGAAVLERYEGLKRERAALDFDDLINHTLDLLQRRDMAAWVMFKLDGGLDHILIDEGQDTNPEQWEIIQALCEDFFAGQGAREDIRQRTVFCVGDEKQSIYSFQRAAPEKFQAMRRYFRQRAQEAGQKWRDESLMTSFRSAPSVLRLVDAVFADDAAGSGLGESWLSHISYRKNDAGLVELWPLFTPPEKDEQDFWSPASRPSDGRSASARLAEHIGSTIAGWMEKGETLESKGRAICPGDIMILVRRRTGLVNQIIRVLKTKKISVAGVDRMVLKDELAVQDLLAAASFALLPEDDLALACLLKSPLIGWDDKRLEAYAHGRAPGQSLWSVLAASKDSAVAAYLEGLVKEAGIRRPYEFFGLILQRPCPADARSGLHGFSCRLGQEALDPIDEFMNMALAFEREDRPSLQSFVSAIARSADEIKREQEQAGNQVRIMTVHAAKGLQAPIVILPDTVRHSRTPSAKSGYRLIWPDKSGLSLPLWSGRKGEDCGAYSAVLERMLDRQDEEYRRLLYVAMTRAEDRLYVCGHKGRKNSSDPSWYDYVARGFEASGGEVVPFVSSYFEGTKDQEAPPVAVRLSNPQVRTEKGGGGSGDKSGQREIVAAEFGALPSWLLQAPKAEPSPPRPLTPSRPAGTPPPASSPLAQPDNLYRFRRGNLTHRLLQILPDLPQQRRAAAAQIYLDRHATDVSKDIRADIAAEALALLAHPDCAPLFGPGSLAEVPLSGMAGARLVNGQVDRLLVQEKTVWIIDYKTNRPPPQQESGVPALYREQMQAYRDIVAAIYPGRAVRCFLLWTDGPRLMELSF